jgi:hypothetical protein
MPRRFLCLIALVLAYFASSTAWAGKYDLDLTPLGTVRNNGTIVQDNAGFRSLASEVGAVVAPRPVDTADSLGLSGFALSADVGINTINKDQHYWQQTSSGPSSVVPTLQFMGRKGLWPGLEVGAGATKVFDSRMWTIGGYGKIAIHEGFHHLPIPSIAIRGMFSRLLGSKDLDLTTVSVGISLSHVFGLGSTVNLTPYVGYQALMILARTGVIDATPGWDEHTDGAKPCDNGDATCTVSPEFVFKQQDAIVRHRPYLGLRMIYSVIRVTFEAMFTPPGKSEDTSVAADAVKDSSGLNQHYTVSVGLDF